MSSLQFKAGKALYSRDGENWFEEPFHGPQRQGSGVITKVDAEAGTITIEATIPNLGRRKGWQADC